MFTSKNKIKTISKGRDFNINLVSQFNQTLAGFIMEECGKMPEKGFRLEKDGVIFIVESLSKNKIEKVFMKETKE